MSWKFIFNTSYLDAGSFRDDAVKLVRLSGYKFYSWNGDIYTVDGLNTGIEAEDCF